MNPGTRPPRRVGLLIALAAAVLFSLVDASPAEAAPVTVLSSSPADGQTLVTSPPDIKITFSQAIGSASSVVITCNGNLVAQPGARPTEDLLTLVVDLSATPLPRGSCVVGWQVQGLVDAGTNSGNFSFVIQQDSLASPVPSKSTTPGNNAPVNTAPSAPLAPTDPPNIGGVLGLARLLVTLALAALFGSFVLIAVAWPEGVEYILTIRFLRYAWLVAMLASVVGVVCMTAQATGNSFTSSLSPTGWFELAHSTPGLAALARMAFIAGSAWVVIRPERCIDPATQLPALALGGLAVATLGFSRVGGTLELLGYAAGTLHALAMAVWLGGVLLLSRVVLAGPGDDDLIHAVRGFSRFVAPAWILTLITGFFQLYRLDSGHLLDTAHGRLLLLKVLVVSAMVFIAVATRQFIIARLFRADVMTAPNANSLRRAVGMEAIAGVVVLGLTAWMLASPPGNLNSSGLSVSNFASTQRFVDPAGKLDLKVYVNPSKVGRNELLVQLIEPTAGVSQLTIRFDPPITSAASPVILTVPLSVAGVAHLNQDIGIPLGVAGAWTMTVDVVASTGTFRQTGQLNVLADTSKAVRVSVPTVTQPIVTSPPGVGLTPSTTTIAAVTTTIAGASG